MTIDYTYLDLWDTITNSRPDDHPNEWLFDPFPNKRSYPHYKLYIENFRDIGNLGSGCILLRQDNKEADDIQLIYIQFHMSDYPNPTVSINPINNDGTVLYTQGNTVLTSVNLRTWKLSTDRINGDTFVQVLVDITRKFDSSTSSDQKEEEKRKPVFSDDLLAMCREIATDQGHIKPNAGTACYNSISRYLSRIYGIGHRQIQPEHILSVSSKKLVRDARNFGKSYQAIYEEVQHRLREKGYHAISNPEEYYVDFHWMCHKAIRNNDTLEIKADPRTFLFRMKECIYPEVLVALICGNNDELTPEKVMSISDEDMKVALDNFSENLLEIFKYVKNMHVD